MSRVPPTLPIPEASVDGLHRKVRHYSFLTQYLLTFYFLGKRQLTVKCHFRDIDTWEQNRCVVSKPTA